MAINALKWLNGFVPGINQFNDPLNDKFLKLVVDGALRHLPRQSQVKSPLPQEFVSQLLRESNSCNSLVGIRDRLIITLSYSLLLRHDEVAHISCSHLSEVDGGLRIAIPSCKTDVYKNGGQVLLSHGNVLSLLRRYMRFSFFVWTNYEARQQRLH